MYSVLLRHSDVKFKIEGFKGKIHPKFVLNILDIVFHNFVLYSSYTMPIEYVQSKFNV